MSQHYKEIVAREDPMSHVVLPLDPVHYLKSKCQDKLMPGMICVTEWNTGRIKETLTEDAFNARYSLVDPQSDPDQKTKGNTTALLVTSPNGTQFTIVVDDNGNLSTVMSSS